MSWSSWAIGVVVGVLPELRNQDGLVVLEVIVIKAASSGEDPSGSAGLRGLPL